jgi:hypothetical protein
MVGGVQRVLSTVVLVAFVSGCSGYRPASLSLDDSADAGATISDVVKPGQNVRVTLVSGEIIVGKVASVSEAGLDIGHTGNYGYSERMVAASEITLLEIQSWSTGSKIAVYTAAGVFVVGALVAAAFTDGLADGLGGSQ